VAKSDTDGATPGHAPAIEVRSTAATLSTTAPAPPRPMPEDYAISLRNVRAPDQRINAPGGARGQAMRGYEDTFTDIVDFILRVTHRIWEEKAVGYLYEHYAHNVRVAHDLGASYGREAVIEATTAFLGGFPDLRLIADDIVWCGDEDVGFWTSHRLTLVGHNTGWTVWGPPTGRRINLMVIADCHSRENRIDDEFVSHNVSSLVRQLGHDVHAAARRTAALLPQPFEEGPEGEIERIVGQGAPTALDPGETGIEAFVRRTLHELWNWRLLDRVTDRYAPAFRYHGPSDRELFGRADYAAHVLATLTMFPDAAHRVDDVYWMGNDREGYTVAVRWTLTGTHRGPGPYGPPTGRRIRHWGLTHLAIRDGVILEEWTVSNEFQVLQQLYRPRESA
jgi:predicted ester cyclase